MKDSGIDYSNIPPLGEEFFKKATVAWPPAKQQLTIRFDSDVLKLAQGQGQGLPDAHQLHLASSHGRQARPPRALHNAPAEEEKRHNPRCLPARLTFRKG